MDDEDEQKVRQALAEAVIYVVGTSDFDSEALYEITREYLSNYGFSIRANNRGSA